MNFYKTDLGPISLDNRTGERFGDHDQLEVLGYVKIGREKYYVLSCDVCKQDQELFKDYLFLSTIGHLLSKKHPCGCSKAPKWKEDQQIIRCERAARALNIRVEYVHENYTGQRTQLNAVCPEHGLWQSDFTKIINGHGCRACASSAKNLKPDSVMISQFLSTGAFPDGTIFSRSSRKTTQGAKNYWFVTCPECGISGEANSSDLKKGGRPCICNANQRQAYINLVEDYLIPVALKFGIAQDYKQRLQRQNKKSIYLVSNIKVFEFPAKRSCVAAELECKQIGRAHV